MQMRQVQVHSGCVMTEGDELYYEVRGNGTPLLMISGGGDGRWFSFAADLLSDEYQVITYDRRAYGRSTGNAPQNFDIHQESRDAVAILNTVHATPAFIFGNSAGAVIALDMVKTQPQAVRAIIVHEPPVARVHPNAAKWQRFFAGVYWTAFRFGTGPAMLQFVLGAGLPLGAFIKAARQLQTLSPQDAKTQQPVKDDDDFFLKQQLLPVTNYLPDIAAIKKNQLRMFMAAGKISLDKKRFYAETAPILAKMLDCELVIFPGHHVSFLDMATEWSATLRGVLRKA